MNYYEVKAKCGHVGRTKYIIKNFYVCADTGRDAANNVRYLPRVKHHHKDAIICVSEISYEKYILGKQNTDNDPYFKVYNSSDQRRRCEFIDNEIVYEEKETKYKKQTHMRKHLVELLTIKEWKSGRNYAYE